MNLPYLYSKNNIVQMSGTTHVLKKYFHLVQWKGDCEEDVLDVGCGDGRVTANVLYPLLPGNVRKLLGVDISSEMIEFAKVHHTRQKLSYDQLDISTKLLDEHLEEKFDHIFSFYCLHWVQDQSQCITNFYKMLKPGGDIFIVFVAKIILYQVHLILSKRKIWAEHLKNVKEYICPYYFSEDPAREFRSLLSEGGFDVNLCEVIDMDYTFKNNSSWRNWAMAIDPFLKTMSDDQKEDYINDTLNEIKKLNCAAVNMNEDTVQIQYELFVVHAKTKKINRTELLKSSNDLTGKNKK